MVSSAFAGTVSGTVKWEGAVPNLKPLDLSADPSCQAKYSGKSAPQNQTLELGSGNTVGNILVRVKSGLPAGQAYPTPAPLIIKQAGCVYHPHVFGLMKDQDFKFLNSDGILHNVHALPVANRQFNISMSKTTTESVAKKFDKSEPIPFRVKCDVHPWMLSYVAVMDHPFFAVTGLDGKFTLPNLPAGTYEIEAWHEKAGSKIAKVTVAASGTQTVDFSFSK